MKTSGLTAGTSSTALTGPGVAAKLRPRNESGQVAEWLKAHAWRACKRLKPFRGFESLPVRRSPRLPVTPVPTLTRRSGLRKLGITVSAPAGTRNPPGGYAMAWVRQARDPAEPETIGHYRVTRRLG